MTTTTTPRATLWDAGRCSCRLCQAAYHAHTGCLCGEPAIDLDTGYCPACYLDVEDSETGECPFCQERPAALEYLTENGPVRGCAECLDGVGGPDVDICRFCLDRFEDTRPGIPPLTREHDGFACCRSCWESFQGVDPWDDF